MIGARARLTFFLHDPAFFMGSGGVIMGGLGGLLFLRGRALDIAGSPEQVRARAEHDVRSWGPR